MLQTLKKKIAYLGSMKKPVLLFCAALILTIGIGTTAAYVMTGTPSLVNLFTNGLSPDGDLIIQKKIIHSFGDTYKIPEGLAFSFEVNLGKEYAGETVKTTQGEMTADANGVITVTTVSTASNTGRTAVYDIDADTLVTVKEVQAGTGFRAETAEQSLTIIKHQDNELVFNNIYEPDKADTSALTVSGSKTLVGREWIEGDSFTFALEVYENGTWETLGTEAIAYELVEQAEPTDPEKMIMVPKTDFDKFDFTELIRSYNFTHAGTYSFRVSEVEGTVGGITYDKAESEFDVMIGDADMDGYLEIQSVISTSENTTVENTAVSIAFENKYAPEGSAEAYINITKKLEDTSGQNKLPSGFTFVLYDEAGNVYRTSEATGAGGETFIYLVYEPEAAGKTFTYTLKEEGGGQTVGAMTYDAAEYKIQVSVFDNLDGTVGAYVYDYQEPDVMTGQDALSEESENMPSDENAAVTENATDSENVAVTENAAVSENTAVSENVEASENTTGTENAEPMEAAANAGLRSLNKEAEAHEEMQKNNAENVNASAVSIPTGATNTYKAIFTNKYDPQDAAVIINGSKSLTGRTINAEEFTFNLYQTGPDFTVAEDAQPIHTAVNTAPDTETGGVSTFTFETVTFDTVGTKYYVVTEDDSAALGGITYDTARYLITVDVTDESGVLKAAATVTDAYGKNVDISDITFANSYKAASVSLPLGGKKILHGGDLKKEMFRFLLYVADENFVPQGELFQKVTNDVEGIFTFNDLVFKSAATYRYVVTEDASAAVEGTSYDDTVYCITVQVTDPGDGQLVISSVNKTADGEAVEDIIFENTYTEPEKPTEPSEPSKPTEPSEPSEPTEPSESTKPSEPDSSEESAETTEQEDDTAAEGTHTGDSSNIILYLAIVVLSGAAVLFVYIMIRHQKRR